MTNLNEVSTLLGSRFPRGTATYMTEDAELADRLRELATRVGTARDLGQEGVQIAVTAGREGDACLLFGSALPAEDQDRVLLILEGDKRIVATLGAVLNRCRYSWFLDLLETGTWGTHFQPIVRLADRAVVGHEALLRAREGNGSDVAAGLAVTAARATGRMREFDRRARTAAMLNACAKLGTDGDLYLNVEASTIASGTDLEEFIAMVEACGRQPRRLVVEFIESERLLDDPRIRELRAKLRALGIRVALDNLTSGLSTQLVLDELRPDIAKLDRRLVRGAHCDRFRGLVLKALVERCRDLEIPVVAQGIETREDLDFIASLGAPLAQGFLFETEGEALR